MWVAGGTLPTQGGDCAVVRRAQSTAPAATCAAGHPEQARGAAERITIAYEPLEPVVDMERATEQQPLHDESPTRGHGYFDDPRPNVVRHMTIRHGDPDAGGDVTVSGY